MKNRSLVVLLAVALVILIFTTGCGKKKVYHTINGSSCTTSQTAEGAVIECDSGRVAVIRDGSDGVNGIDGLNGVNGTSSIVNVVDPCGDSSTGPDEVLLIMDNGQVIAWYQSLGLTLLQPGQHYVTTDTQQCHFQVDSSGNVMEL